MRRFLTLLLLALLAGCAGSGGSGESSTTFTDDYGRCVAVPASPQRIVSLSPAVTEILFALGAGEQLVGRTDFCTYPPEVAAIPSVGGISNLNIEEVLALRPDLVIAGSILPKKQTDLLDRMGVPVACIREKEHFDGLYDNITAIGALVGHPAQAETLNRRLRSRLDSLNAGAGVDATPPSLYYVVGFGAAGNFTAGSASYINDIITLAGARNVAAGIRGWSYSIEALMEADPDYILIRREDSAAFAAMHPYDSLTAVKKGRLVGIESGLIDLQVPRNIQAIQAIRGAIR